MISYDPDKNNHRFWKVILFTFEEETKAIAFLREALLILLANGLISLQHDPNRMMLKENEASRRRIMRARSRFASSKLSDIEFEQSRKK